MKGIDSEGPIHLQPWNKAAFRRRGLLVLLVLLTTGVATGLMGPLLLRQGWFGLEWVLIALFAVLFAWISIGFWVSFFGFVLLARGRDRFAVTRNASPDPGPIPDEARTAILFPICNEEVGRVFAGIYATWRSLEQTGCLGHFDFFILSDTGNPDTWVEEEAAWARLCRDLGGEARIFYRRRRVNLKRKSGNVADFCRRWGRAFRYMVVFDADSVMAGSTIVTMVRLMEQRPDIGILQTAPRAVNLETLFARLQQFANHVYGPLFAAGLHFWQLGDGQYWGHNAIIRVAPFMEHCGLARLPGKPPLGGDILSHDFVEAALMRRAGWGVWLAYDLGGSYEEVPPALLGELSRDRRWCQGNMQHLRLLLTRGISRAHRALFLNGAMAYVSALLWFLFLSVSTLVALANAFFEPDYFPARFSLFPEWPVWKPQWAVILLAVTAVILFLPKLLGALYLLADRRQRRLSGGAAKVLPGVLAEAVLSTLFAPIRMVFHSKFVFMTLLGHQVSWGGQARGDRPTGWLEAFRFHGTGMLLAFFWGMGMYLINPAFFWWLTPILAALVLSVPLSAWFSRVNPGRKLRKWGVFLIPEEVAPPRELVWLREYLERTRALSPLGIDRTEGFRLAVVDPAVHALHLALLRGERKVSPVIAARRKKLRQKALALGPNGLTAAEKKRLLSDPGGLRELHEAVWELADEDRASGWGLHTPSA